MAALVVVGIDDGEGYIFVSGETLDLVGYGVCYLPFFELFDSVRSLHQSELLEVRPDMIGERWEKFCSKSGGRHLVANERVKECEYRVF
jgi:TusA-related sulfurtransferase